jgi:hypothetical protein
VGHGKFPFGRDARSERFFSPSFAGVSAVDFAVDLKSFLLGDLHVVDWFIFVSVGGGNVCM